MEITKKLVEFLNSKGVKVENKNDSIFFNYTINDVQFVINLKKNSSDPNVFLQILLYNEYKVIIDFLIANEIELTSMIDAGANIGLTSIFFKAYFPNLNIIALEPSSNTFKRLNQNIKNNNLSSITCLKKGIWSHSTYLSSDNTFRDCLDWAFRLVETSDKKAANIEVLSVLDIMKQNNLELIDFLKIDIEGGEVALFSANTNLNWLKKVKILALEIHDEFECRVSIENILSKFGFTLFNSGELTIGINEKLILEGL